MLDFKRTSTLALAVVTVAAIASSPAPLAAAPTSSPHHLSTTDPLTSLDVFPAQNTLAGRQPTIVIAPGWNCLASDYSEVTALLRSRGFTVAVFTYDDNSRLAVVDWDRKLGVALDALLAADSSATSPLHFTIDRDRLGILGHSLGAAAAALAVSHDARYKAVALFGPEARDHVFLDAAKTIRAAILTIDGSLDRVAPPDQRSKPIVDAALSKYAARLVIKNGCHSNCPADFNADFIRDPGRWVVAWTPFPPFFYWKYDFPIVPGIKPMPGVDQRKIAFPYLAAWMDRFVAGKAADGWTTGTEGDAALQAGKLTEAWFNAAARSGH